MVFCEGSIRNEETGEVIPAMKKLADSADVVSVSSTSDSEFCHTYATINFKIDDNLVDLFGFCYIDLAGDDCIRPCYCWRVGESGLVLL